MYRELLDICAEADCLVSSPFQIVARMIYEKLGIPFVSVHMSQFGALGTKAVQSVSASIVNRCRAEFGHPPLKDPLGQEGTSPDLALYAVSNRVLRRPAAWPAHHHVVGFFFLEESGFVPDEALQAFMEGPDKPIVVSFGSMIHEAPEKVTDILVKVVDKLGRRTVIQRGWSGLGSAAVAGRIRIVDFVPHYWLFSRASCVVHHGGAGTTAATFKAGVPAVVVPHTLDQPIWGQIARAFGCAPVVIPFMQLTVDGLVKGLEEALNNPKYANSAASLSRGLALENGVCTARQLVERLVSEKSWRRAGETAKMQRTGGA